MEKAYSIIITAVALVLAALHIFAESSLNIQIDGTAIFLLVLAAFAPYAGHIARRISAIELPGGAKIALDINKVEEDTTKAIQEEAAPEAKQRLQERVSKALAEAPPAEPAQQPPPLSQVQLWLGEAPEWRLAGVRIEIERTLREILTELRGSAPETARPGSLTRYARELLSGEIISPALHESIQSFARIANRAIHGERVSPSDAERVAETGFFILERLKEKLNLIRELKSKAARDAANPKD